MSKELDEAWITIYHYNDEIIHDMGSEYVENPLKEELDIVNNALLELKAIKEAKPDKVLETLKDMLIGNGINDSINDYVDNLILPIKQALLKPDKNEKIILGIEDYINRRIEIEPIEDVRKAFIEIIKQLQVIKEVANNE